MLSNLNLNVQLNSCWYGRLETKEPNGANYFNCDTFLRRISSYTRAIFSRMLLGTSLTSAQISCKNIGFGFSCIRLQVFSNSTSTIPRTKKSGDNTPKK